MSLSKSAIALLLAVCTEIIATTFLAMSESFRHLMTGGLAILLYILSYYFLSLALRRIPIGVAYAIWSSVGVLSITVIHAKFFEYLIDSSTSSGVTLVIIGSLILNLAIKQKK